MQADTPATFTRLIHMRACAALISLSIATFASAQEYASLPGIAVSNNAVFARLPQGGIQAIDLKTGSILWRSSLGRWPLAVGQGKLLALGPLSQGNFSSVVYFDIDTGRSTAQVGPIQFAPWASVHFDYDRHGDSTFRLWLRTMDAGSAIFLWQAERYPQTTLRNWNKPQTKMIQTGRFIVSFQSNAVDSVFSPIGERPPPLPQPDRSLPMLKGQHALASINLDVDSELALISANGNVDVACFRDRVLQWSVRVTGSLK